MTKATNKNHFGIIKRPLASECKSESGGTVQSLEFEIIYSKRRTIAIEVKSDSGVVVRAPMRMKYDEIQRFVESKAHWLEKHIAIAKQRLGQKAPALTEAEIKSLANAARGLIPLRVAYYAEKIGVTYGKITIRCQRKRWGSCSSKGNLNFNCLLMLCPTEILNYVVVHELCHLIEMNHSPRFWANVGRVIPEYKIMRKWLKDNEGLTVGRLKQQSE